VSDPRDYKVELTGAGGEAPAGIPPKSRSASGGVDSAGTPRPYLSVHFACCGVYQRVYRDRDGTTYQGRCPRCATPVKFVVGQGGTAARSFVVR
jgi:hypothetical protein